MVGHAFWVDECSCNLHEANGRNISTIHHLICSVYLYDILIFSQTWEEHLHHMQQVLQTLWKHKFCANLEK